MESIRSPKPLPSLLMASSRQNGIITAKNRGFFTRCFPSAKVLEVTLTSSKHGWLGRIRFHKSNFFTATWNVGILPSVSELYKIWENRMQLLMVLSRVPLAGSTSAHMFEGMKRTKEKTETKASEIWKGQRKEWR